MTAKNQYRWLYLSGFFILLAIVFLLIPPKRRERAPVTTVEEAQKQITVSKIIDGDTFELSDGNRVRLIGVDTPESNQPFYGEAMALSESLLLGRRIGHEAGTEERDRYGRLLWHVYADSIFVNAEIVARGMGQVYLFQPNLEYAEELIESQKRAREARLGIWSLPAPPPEDYYIALRGSYRFHRPLCMSIKNANPDKIVEYRSRDSLLDRGMSPCRNCRP